MLKKRILGMLLLGAMLTLLAAVPAIAAVEKTPRGGGSVSITLTNANVSAFSNEKSTIKPNVKIDGGDWQYQAYLYNGVYYGYSNYYHPDDYHTSWVQDGPNGQTYDSDYTAPGYTSYASGPLYSGYGLFGYYIY
ncbi:MAG: lactococcin 972 family bacteriocin [Syntrophomonas sp.]